MNPAAGPARDFPPPADCPATVPLLPSTGWHHWSSRPSARIALVIGAWLLVAVAWTTPTYLVQNNFSATTTSWAETLSSLIASFVPWALATPFILRLSTRFPLMRPHVARNAAIHAITGLILVPILTAAGVLLMGRLLPAFEGEPVIAWNRYLFGVAVNAFYAVPTYAAVVGIAQAVVYQRHYRSREQSLTRARMTALRHQLNPHFLFNALNAISTLGYRDPEAADRALNQMALILRKSLEEGADKVALREEIEVARSYMDVYQHLLPLGLDFHELVAGDVFDASVPRMLLQPLLENAVKHSIVSGSKSVDVEISAGRVEDQLEIVVRNDGARSGRRGRGIGLENISERLRLLYGNRHVLKFSCSPTGVATVTIRLPIELHRAPVTREDRHP